MIKIKPHHFMDVIKLYGAGITTFVPDKKLTHSFYIVANKIIQDRDICLKLTIDGDDICSTCQNINSNSICEDSISHIDNINSKDVWNKILDKRILQYSKLKVDEMYSSYELCRKLYFIKDNIFDIWKEDDLQKTKLRYENFCKGAEKFLEI